MMGHISNCLLHVYFKGRCIMGMCDENSPIHRIILLSNISYEKNSLGLMVRPTEGCWAKTFEEEAVSSKFIIL